MVIERVQVAENRSVHIQRLRDLLRPQPRRRLHPRDDLAVRPREHQPRVAAAVHERQELGFLDADEGFGAQGGGKLVPLGQVADAADVGEVDGDGAGAAGDAVARQGILVGVAGGVVGLAVAADDAGVGGQEDEEIHVCGEEGVQVPGPLHFGPQGGVEVCVGHGGEGVVLCCQCALAWMFSYVEIS